jgi:hypothetical protein
VADAARRHPLPVGTKLAMGLAVLTPNLFLGLALRAHVQLTPLAILLVFWAVWRTYVAVSAEAGSPDRVEDALCITPDPLIPASAA